MLSYLWVVTVITSRLLTNAFFSYIVFVKGRFTSFLARDHISENQYVEITSEYGFYMESLVIVTFLFSQCVESHMVTRVPSPTISIAKRTALCPPMDSLRKQSTSKLKAG